MSATAIQGFGELDAWYVKSLVGGKSAAYLGEGSGRISPGRIYGSFPTEYNRELLVEAKWIRIDVDGEELHLFRNVKSPKGNSWPVVVFKDGSGEKLKNLLFRGLAEWLEHNLQVDPNSGKSSFQGMQWVDDSLYVEIQRDRSYFRFKVDLEAHETICCGAVKMLSLASGAEYSVYSYNIATQNSILFPPLSPEFLEKAKQIAGADWILKDVSNKHIIMQHLNIQLPPFLTKDLPLVKGFAFRFEKEGEKKTLLIDASGEFYAFEEVEV